MWITGHAWYDLKHVEGPYNPNTTRSPITACIHIYIQYSMSLWYTSVIRSYLLPYKLNRYHLLCEKHLQVISKCMHKLIIFPIKRKFLDLIFMQIGHFLVKFYTSTLYFNIFRWIPYESWFFATVFVCHKNTPTPKNLRPSHAYTIFSNHI